MINLLIILVFALLGHIACKTLKQPIILGELFAGIVIAILGIAVLTEPIRFIADIGILVLLFTTGLSLDLRNLERMGKQSAVIAFTGAFFPFLFGYGLAILSGFNLVQALFIGSILVATSIGVNAKILSEFRMLRTKLGTLIIGSAAFDDIIGIMILGVLGGLVAGTNIVNDTIILAITTAAFFAISIFVITKVMREASRHLVFKSENLVILGLIIAFVFALIAQNIGLELLLGAFLGGLVMGQTRYPRDLLENISIFGESFFIPIFFVTVGMQFDLFALGSIGLFTILFILLAITSKVIGASLGSIITGLNKKQSFAIGIAMVPRAEIAIVIAGIGLSTGLIGKDIVSAGLAMVVVTMLVTPPWLAGKLKALKTEETRF